MLLYVVIVYNAPQVRQKEVSFCVPQNATVQLSAQMLSGNLTTGETWMRCLSLDKYKQRGYGTPQCKLCCGHKLSYGAETDDAVEGVRLPPAAWACLLATVPA